MVMKSICLFFNSGWPTRFGFRFFGFHFEYGLITDETYSRRQINTGTKFEVSHLHNIFEDIEQSGPSMD